jgi:hypothetical protein
MNGFGRLGVPAPDPLRENRLFQAAGPRATVLVEAAPDRAFWAMWLADGVLLRSPEVDHRPLPDGSRGPRAQAIALVRKAAAEGDLRVLAILDADLGRVLGEGLPNDPNLIFTDGHDLEVTLALSPALAKVARAHAPEVLQRWEAEWGEPFDRRLWRHALGMGQLRLLKILARPRYDALLFKKYPQRPQSAHHRAPKERRNTSLEYFHRYEDCSGPRWAPDIAACWREICNYNNAQGLKAAWPAVRAELLHHITRLDKLAEDQVLNGHDIIGFLSAFLTEYGRSRPSVASLRRELGLAYTAADLEASAMGQRIRAWEHARACVVLREFPPPTPEPVPPQG